MKKIAILLSLLVMVSLSCDKSYKFYAFYIEKTVDVQFESGSFGDFEITQDVNVAIERVLEDHDTDADLIEEITIEEISLREVLFDDFNELNLFISAEGITETSLATSDTTVTSFDVTSLNVSTEIMDDYVKSPTFSLRTSAQLSSSHSPAFAVPLNLRFLVKTYVK